MIQEITYEEGAKRLSEANQVYKIRMETLENKLAEISQGVEKYKESENTNPSGTNELQDLTMNQMQTMKQQTQQWKNATAPKFEEKQQQRDLLTNNLRDL